jgi:hypothetical protein
MDLEFSIGVALDFHVESTWGDECLAWSREIALGSFFDREIAGFVQLLRQRLRETQGHVLHEQDGDRYFRGKDGKNLGKCERAAGRNADEKQFWKRGGLEAFGRELYGGRGRVYCLDS